MRTYFCRLADMLFETVCPKPSFTHPDGNNLWLDNHICPHPSHFCYWLLSHIENPWNPFFQSTSNNEGQAIALHTYQIQQWNQSKCTQDRSNGKSSIKALAHTVKFPNKFHRWSTQNSWTHRAEVPCENGNMHKYMLWIWIGKTTNGDSTLVDLLVDNSKRSFSLLIGLKPMRAMVWLEWQIITNEFLTRDVFDNFTATL